MRTISNEQIRKSIAAFPPTGVHGWSDAPDWRLLTNDDREAVAFAVLEHPDPDYYLLEWVKPFIFTLVGCAPELSKWVATNPIAEAVGRGGCLRTLQILERWFTPNTLASYVGVGSLGAHYVRYAHAEALDYFIKKVLGSPSVAAQALKADPCEHGSEAVGDNYLRALAGYDVASLLLYALTLPPTAETGENLLEGGHIITAEKRKQALDVLWRHQIGLDGWDYPYTAMAVQAAVGRRGVLYATEYNPTAIEWLRDNITQIARCDPATTPNGLFEGKKYSDDQASADAMIEWGMRWREGSAE